MLFSKKKAKTFGDVEKSSYLCTRNSEIRHALVAQLVEHLTLNQGVQGSSPCRRTKQDNLYSEVVLFCIFTFHEIPKS